MFKKFKNVRTKKMKGNRFEDTPLGVQLLTAGTAACVADTISFPLDTTKVLLQVQGEGKSTTGAKIGPRHRGVFNTIATIAKEEGPKRLYKGLWAGLQRQMCFASIRVGLYDTVKSFYQRLIGGEENRKAGPGVLTRISAGITTGALAVLVAQPTDVVKIRFQAQRGREERYKSTTEAYKTILKHEGVRGLWKGTAPNIARNAIVNVSEIVCYDIVKEAILTKSLMEDNTLCHFTSAVIAGFCTTVMVSPVDVIKTRYMNSPKGMYKNTIDCAIRTIKAEGATAFYKGFTPSFSRLVTWNIAMWITYEKLKFLVTKVFSDK